MRKLTALFALVVAAFGALALIVTPPATAGTPATACHPAYSPCLPAAGDLDCPEVLAEHTAGEPVTLRGQADPYNLDVDGDGIGCEGSDNPTTAPPSSPPASPSAEPTTEPTSTPRPSRFPVATTPVAAGPDDDAPAAGPQLPVTGPIAATLAGVGALLLLIGGVAIVVSRRRRVHFQA